MSPEDLFKGTPVSNLIPKIQSARFKYVHLSDIARLVVIYKFGGIYSDWDVILRRKVDFGSKFITQGAGSPMIINSVFANTKHDAVLYETMEALRETYEPKGYTVMYEYETVAKRNCKAHCGVNQEFFQNKTSFMCCDLRIVGKFLPFLKARA